MPRISICILFLLFAGRTTFAQPASKTDSFVYACSPCHLPCDTIRHSEPGTCPYCSMPLEKISLTAMRERIRKYLLVPQQSVTVCFYLQDGVEVLDFAGPMEVFDAAGFKVFTVSRNKSSIKAQGILNAVANYTIEDAPPADVIAFFGGETRASTSDTALLSWVRTRSRSSAYTLSVCTGAFILAKAGVLDNLTATTYHTAIDGLAKASPSTTVLHNVRFVDNGKVITTAGVSAGIDGALHLVERLKGREFARTVADLIEYDKWVPEQGMIIKN